jgi:phage-related protein
VFDKLWDDGELSSSWEMTVTDSEKDGDCTILKVFEFIGNACLGRLKTPCVPGAGVIEYAELEKDIDTELAEALEKDLVNLDIEENDVKEDIGLAENTKKKIENEETEDTKTSVKETDDKEKYNATLQMFFTINTVSVFLIHVFQGHVSGAMLPLVGAALAGTAVGTAVGMFLFRRLTMTGIKKVVYIFMMCAGSYLLLS